ncbi:SpoIIE family protein phosphatase [Actinacidiphila sp. bgisy167]|uniref:SpoIIE family protein phosphatase n=1 Tax=Actinacidiphila sp. bgisy167 TaxID=3413797 RepID=UPI003D72891A
MGTPEERVDAGVADAVTLLLDARGRLLSWPAAAERLLGRRAADVLGTPAVDLLVPEDAACTREIAERCCAEGGWTGVLRLRRDDGRKVTLGVRVAGLPEGIGGSPVRWMVLAAESGSTARSMASGMTFTMLERIVGQTPIGLAVVDTELRCVWSNAALERFGGGPSQARRGRRLAEIQPGLNALVLEAQMRQVLETGVPVIDYEHVGRFRTGPRREQAHSMSFVRLEDARGVPVGVCYSVIDISDRWRARKRLSLLDRASEHLGRTLDVMHTAQDLADVVVPDLADYVAVELLESVIKGAEPQAGRLGEAVTVPLRRAGMRSARQGEPPPAFGLGAVSAYQEDTPPIRCLTDGTSWLGARLDPLGLEWAAGTSGGRALHFGELGMHTAMVVPIRARGVTLGVTLFFRVRRAEPFDEEDLRLAEEVVGRAAVCLDNARRYTRERDAALVLQRSLLPHAFPPQDAVEVATYYGPADELSSVGGDWFDVIPLSGARVALVVGEVVGHGIEAAAAMGRLRTAVRTLADLDLPPEELLAHLDDLVVQVSREAGESAATGVGGSSLGSTCLYVTYDPVSRHCVMASAGHPPPAVLRPPSSRGGAEDGAAVRFPELSVGPALGLGGLPFEATELRLEEGSVLALYTDGLVAPAEGADDVHDGRSRLRAALEAGDAPLDALCGRVVRELAPARPHDDVALLLARTRGLGTGRVVSWDLPTDPAVVGRARELSSRQLADWGLGELAFTTELVVSELVTNAIRHGSGPIRLRLILERALICEVSDASSTSPHLRHPRTTDEGGRGLFLISQFAQRWGTRYTDDGKIIWAEQFLDGQGPEGGGAGVGFDAITLAEPG